MYMIASGLSSSDIPQERKRAVMIHCLRLQGVEDFSKTDAAPYRERTSRLPNLKLILIYLDVYRLRARKVINGRGFVRETGVVCGLIYQPTNLRTTLCWCAGSSTLAASWCGNCGLRVWSWALYETCGFSGS